MAQMKWWGWGDEGVAFTHEDKPALAPFIHSHIGLDVTTSTSPHCGFDDLDVPEPALPPGLRADLESAVGEQHVSAEPLERLVHARGKCLRDLVRHRAGDIGRIPTS